MKRRRRVFVIEDEQATRDFLSAGLAERYDVECASSGEEGLERLIAGGADLLLLDLNLPELGGMDVLKEMHHRMENPPTTIICTADSSLNTAVEAVRGGAYDYLVKPFSMDRLTTVLDRAVEHTRLVSENRNLRQTLSDARKFRGMLGNSDSVLQLKADIEKVADTRGTVLLTGESGTGKELAARAIHELSYRRKGPYLRINCAAIPETLLEAELFGAEKGTYTGQIDRRIGVFERADGGTVLLDEVTEITTAVQAKLLRVLQEREVQRLGSSGRNPIKVDVRVIATSNKDLRREVREGRFKEDLYYRLHVIPLHIAPLRDRSDDVPVLAQFFIERACAENGRAIMKVSDRAMKTLSAYPWPGNVRELENSLERTVILNDSDTIDVDDLRLDNEGLLRAPSASLDDNEMTLRDMEKELILRRLTVTGGNRTRAARLLGISVRTLRNKINQYRGEGVSIPG